MVILKDRQKIKLECHIDKVMLDSLDILKCQAFLQILRVQLAQYLELTINKEGNRMMQVRMRISNKMILNKNTEILLKDLLSLVTWAKLV